MRPYASIPHSDRKHNRLSNLRMSLFFMYRGNRHARVDQQGAQRAGILEPYAANAASFAPTMFIALSSTNSAPGSVDAELF